MEVCLRAGSVLAFACYECVLVCVLFALISLLLPFSFLGWEPFQYLGKAPSLDCAMQGGTLRVCTMAGEPMCRPQGETLLEVEGSKRCM